MEIKTVAIWASHPGMAREFDAQVNRAIAEGWRLSRREIFPAGNNSPDLLYAELVKLDAPAEFDPLAAVRGIRAMCINTPLETCNTAKCPLYAWCGQITEGKDPSDWILPDEEGGA